jgi:hypothetical protein
VIRSILFLGLAVLAAQPAPAGLFGKQATSVADIHGSPRPMTVTAPNGRTRAIARFSDFTAADSDDGHLSVFLGGDDHDFPGGANGELLWAPDSNAIAVTADNGGIDGQYETTIMIRPDKGRHWRETDITDKIAKLFKPRMDCEEDEDPNVGAIGWTSGQRLIVAAQVPRRSSCVDRGSFAAYVVDVDSGDVLMELDQRAIRQRYTKMLGSVLTAGPVRHRKHRR